MDESKTSSIEEEDREHRFRQLIHEISAAKKEYVFLSFFDAFYLQFFYYRFIKLWFEDFENYNLVLDPEFESFLETYRLALLQVYIFSLLSYLKINNLYIYFLG